MLEFWCHLHLRSPPSPPLSPPRASISSARTLNPSSPPRSSNYSMLDPLPLSASIPPPLSASIPPPLSASIPPHGLLSLFQSLLNLFFSFDPIVIGRNTQNSGHIKNWCSSIVPNLLRFYLKKNLKISIAAIKWLTMKNRLKVESPILVCLVPNKRTLLVQASYENAMTCSKKQLQIHG
ncbi:uncharacterized protein LOC144547259 isoform X1 [Carex rostrata]